jgi:hypothetical protein
MDFASEAVQVKRFVSGFDELPNRGEFAVVDGVGAQQEPVTAGLEFQMAARAGTKGAEHGFGESHLSLARYFDQHDVMYELLTNEVKW